MFSVTLTLYDQQLKKINDHYTSILMKKEIPR
jgi:hypothetical protein